MKLDTAIRNANNLKESISHRIELEMKIIYANQISNEANIVLYKREKIIKGKFSACVICGEYGLGRVKGLCRKCYSISIYDSNAYRKYRAVKTSSRYKQYRANAKRRNYVFELAFEEFEELIRQSCIYCGNVAIEGIELNGIDRVDNSIGYIKSNCVPCCKVCNRAKFIYTSDEFKKYAHRLSYFNDYKPNWVRNIEPQ